MKTRSLLVLVAVASVVLAAPAEAATLFDGFEEEVVFVGLTKPTAIRFAQDGRVFIAEKSGLIKVFDGLDDPSPQTLADLRTNVHDYWDRGMLGLAIDPLFPAQPYLYVFYTYNFDPHDPGSPFPRWPDSCPNPPGGTSDGCTVNGRISRLEVAPNNTLVGGEVVLLENRWCQQFPSHSVGDLVFDDQARVLYASAGEGASWQFTDYGQEGSPRNPCDDPPGGQGGNQSPPSAEGGSLRAQDLQTSGDPVGLSGTVIAIDPDTGDAASTNPLLGGDPDDDPIIAFGLRNPYRLTFREGTNQVWIGDVGKSTWDEINRIADTDDSILENFGWPCYEGPERFDNFDEENLTLCEDLYDFGGTAVTHAFFAYEHDTHFDPDTEPFRCSKTNGAAISGLAFYTGNRYPASYAGALFLADYTRDCLFVMEIGGSGDPNPATRTTFADAVSNPVDLRVGPDGLLYYVDHSGGRVLRIKFCAATDGTCDGWDDDCDQQIDEDYAPASVSCGLGECHSMGTTACLDGAVADDCIPGTPTADDNCNDLDDDCDGVADDDASPPVWTGMMTLDRSAMSWDPIPGAEAYEILRGSLSLLTSTGDFSIAVTECLEDEWVPTIYPFAGNLEPDTADWFLVAGKNCAGRASFDSGGPGQATSRAEIDQDPDTCERAP